MPCATKCRTPMRACPLAMHFVRQYVGEEWDLDGDELPEREHIGTRARRHEEDDEYAETFEAFEADVSELSHSMNVDRYVVHRPSKRRVAQASASSQAAEPESRKPPEPDA